MNEFLSPPINFLAKVIGFAYCHSTQLRASCSVSTRCVLPGEKPHALVRHDFCQWNAPPLAELSGRMLSNVRLKQFFKSSIRVDIF